MIEAHDGAPALTAEVALPLIEALADSSGAGLLHLAACFMGKALPPTWAWWRDFAGRYLASACTAGDELPASLAAPGAPELAACITDAPPFAGAENLSVERLEALWNEIHAALRAALAKGETLAGFLAARHSAWHVVGRVHFNLAENRKDPAAPFAFLATYVSGLSAYGRPQHLPLSQALAEFAGVRRRAQLLSLLEPVQRAAEGCPWLDEMVQSGEMYHPLRWQPQDAWRFLQDVPRLEAAGIVVRMPPSWAGGRPARPKVSASVGCEPASRVGLEALLDFEAAITLDGEKLHREEIERLLSRTDGLQLLRGRWVEVDRKRLTKMLDRFAEIERRARAGGLSFAEAMRLTAGMEAGAEGGILERDWADVAAGPWLAETLRHLRSPEGLARVDPGPALHATLRPYQQAGVRWLYLLTRLGLGGCLADDMGLGKTIQLLALLLILQRESPGHPSLLVAPASLLANWQAQAERFAPTLRVLVVHPSAMPPEEVRSVDGRDLAGADLVVTTYGMLLKQPVLAGQDWRILAIDEAQAIKNPGAKQTRAVKGLTAQARIALTGTPVENRLSDLWSIFDFTHPGLLGSEKAFAALSRRLGESGHFAPLKKLVQPYILRRLKTDKAVIADLPDKTEMAAWCALTPVQAVLYQRAVKELAQRLERAEGIDRRGLVLAFLMRFKQICNHPSQWLGDGLWRPADSGKFARLKELAEVIAIRQEKMLLFTQFRETAEPLRAFLGGIFGRQGLVLHGGTPVKQRRELVRRFQEDEQTPFFILSLKAGGAGLNLTAARHVIHFDRWWNPAVEDQATDRAFRIGQKYNVLVHKFLCRGTIEERIDALIRDKRELVRGVLEPGQEINLTELDDTALLDLVRLDIHAAEEH